MRALTETLLAAQKSESRIPYLRVEAKNKIAGVVRLDWERLYEGGEDDCFHSLAIAGDGSLVRVRLTPAADGRKLYRQRVENPGPESDYGSWTYAGQYNCLVVAAASCGAEVAVFWVNLSRQLKWIKSADYGVSWSSPAIIDYMVTTGIGGIAAAYKPGGDLAVFIADGDDVYVKKRLGNSWQSKTAWDKATGDISGVAAVYDGDWNLAVTGEDTSGNYRLWSLVYGDGGDVVSGEWSELREMASAPSDGEFEYGSVFLDKSDVYRCFYVEKFTGTEEYSRPFGTHSVPGTAFIDNLWREPVPFDLSAEYGVAVAHYGGYCWLSAPFGVWRAALAEESIDLTGDVLFLEQETARSGGVLTIELDNSDGGYSTLPPPLGTGCQLEVSPGYVTSQGKETSPGQTFMLKGYEYVSRGDKSSLFLYAFDGWGWLNGWRARQQFRWNRSSEEMNTGQIVEFILARSGLKLEVISMSSVITGYYPDFSVLTDNRGDAVLGKLLSFVPDVLYIEGSKAYLVNPLPEDSAVYSYGREHPVTEGRYLKGAWGLNRVQVEGYDSAADEPIVVDSFSWSQISGVYDRLERMEDLNIGTVGEAGQRGAARLREAEIESGGGSIRVPVNCGQQLYDVIDITDERAGMDAEKKRVLGIRLTCRPGRGIYEQKLLLGAV